MDRDSEARLAIKRDFAAFLDAEGAGGGGVSAAGAGGLYAAKIGALGPMTSVYCRDPDGNLIEISTYSRD